MKRLIISMAIALSTALGIGGLSLISQPALACTSVTLSSPIGTNTNVDCNAPGGVIFAYLRIIIQFLSGAIGLVIVLMIVVGGIQYITSAGDPGAVKAAKNRIVNAITGLVLFVLMFAILNFLIPGGILT